MLPIDRPTTAHIKSPTSCAFSVIHSPVRGILVIMETANGVLAQSLVPRPTVVLQVAGD
jgi:hypothetical protein